ncbi:oxygenase MpaB family protein [Pseudonocardia sp. H11422]|uniref:oxygenase MpaB family protein n=1 Tax=Pseudonocardia sp. H11422 TaxID=2835866 RepID=UPI001BDC2ECD|nr:oxygenase MpaB family protein [Pseudonocardia sp. H11422]
MISLDRKDRYDRLREIEQLDPETEYVEIYRIMSGHEFPWDMNQSLSFALFRTYAVPSIGRLLAQTGEFTERVQKRYDDTGLILEAVLENGFAHETGRAAIRRMNQMHRAYPITQDDLRYVLCTFVVVPIRWMDAYGWRPFTEREKVASANYYRELGRHMGITAIPATYQEFIEHLDRYEAEHFGYDDGGRAVADSTLDLMTTFPPNHLAPKGIVRTFSYALMDAPLRDALRYPAPPKPVEVASRVVLKVRGQVVRFMKPRPEPKMVRDMPTVRSYPDGFEVSRLGTFPTGCPVPHVGARSGGAQPEAAARH